jgi:hypothetical protein
MSKAKFAKIVFKKIKEGIPGGPRKGQKVASHGIYDGRRYELDELTPLKARGEKGNFSFHRDKFIPRVVLADKPIVNKKLKTSLTDEAIDKNKYIMDTLESMPDKQLFRLTTKEMDKMFGRNVSSQRKRVLAKRIDPATGKNYKPFEMGLSAFGRHFKKYDEFDNPIAIDRKLKSDLGLKEKNYKKIINLFNDIDSLAESKTMSGINARSSLFLQVNRAIQGGKAAKIPEDKVVQNVIKQVDNSAWGKMLKERNVRAADIKRGEKIGILTKDDRPEISHVIPVQNDLSKALDIQNVFYEPRGINRARPRGEIAQRRDDYLQELDSRIINYDLMDKYSLSKGGLIKKGLQKIIDSAKFDPSRRKFMKQTGATAAAAAMPVGKLTPLAAQAATKTITRSAPPWIKSMVGVLDQLSGPNTMGRTLANGTRIRNYGSKGNTQSYEITNSDGYKVPVNMTKEKNGDLHIEFDIRDDFANNQHIYIDKKTGQVEIVDENYYMTSPEDYAKDDPITWDVTTPSQMQAFERKMGIMRGDGSEKMKDFASLPEDGDYTDLFESFIDSFSPSGNIFNTKAKAKQIAKEQKRLKNLRDEEMEMDFESQFRGGNIHGFNKGGIQVKRKDKPPNPRDASRDAYREYGISRRQGERFKAIKNMSDQEAMARMMMAEDDKNPQGGYGVGHVIYNRSQNPSIYMPNRAEGISPIISVLSSSTGFSPYTQSKTNFFKDYTGNKTYDDYYNYAGEILAGNKQDFTGGADFFALPGTEGNFGLSQAPQYIDQYGAHKFYKSYNQGGMAKEFTVSDAVKEIKANPQNFVGGGLVKKLAPKVIGKLREYSPKITGPKKQGPMRPDKPFTVFDEAGLPIKDFDTEKAARNFLRDDARAGGSADMYTIGTSYSKKAKFPEDDTAGAMFWSSREKLIDAPMESAKGSEWLAYLKRPFAKHNPIKDMELNDTQLSTHLSRNGNKTLSKAQIIEEFDTKLAPEIDVISLGSPKVKESKALTRLYRKTDLQAYRPGPLKNVLSGMKMRIPSLEEAVNNNNKDAILKEIATIEDLVQKNFGVANSITEGFPQKFPYELKQPLQEIASTTGVRLGGFKEYAREASYRGQQTMGGGSNYREFLFKYNHKPGSLRNTEPSYTYAHDFNLTTSQRNNGFVHMRTSDRTDEFGRRILHIEEIQSDMHQPVNAAGRRVKKAQAAGQTNQRAYRDDLRQSKYAERGDLVRETDNANEQQMMLIQSKIEDLLSMPQTKQTQVRLARLNRERAKIRKIIADKRAAAGSGDNSGIPQGPYSKTEDYNEFVMKYALKTAQEGGYDGISISTPAIKNRSTSVGSRDYIGNITAYGPIAEGAMKKVSKKSGAKFMKSVIVDDNNRAYEVPMLLIKDNPQAIDRISKGLGAYKRGGIAVNG